jgi:hypothetical protein
VTSVQDLSADELTRVLAYAGFVLVGFELLKSMIVNPIKAFYANTDFSDGMPFKTYEKDVLSRHRNEFEACLLYLRDLVEAIDSADVLAIQALRKHRNDLAHDLVNRLPALRIDEHQMMFEGVYRALFKLSNYRVRMEIGADPEFQKVGINWESVKGHEYLLFEAVVQKVKLLNLNRDGA